jgi:hypothetical protein
MWEEVNRLYGNTTPFYIRDLSFHGFGYTWGDLEPILFEYQGTTILNFKIPVPISPTIPFLSVCPKYRCTKMHVKISNSSL